jgi:hypothetical protein
MIILPADVHPDDHPGIIVHFRALVDNHTFLSFSRLSGTGFWSSGSEQRYIDFIGQTEGLWGG